MHKIRIKRPYQKPVVVVNTDDESLTRILYAFYNPFIQNPTRLETVSEDRTVEITYEAKIGLFTCQGSTIKIPRGYALQAIENILFESTTVDEEILAIHGAVVGLSGKAFILTELRDRKIHPHRLFGQAGIRLFVGRLGAYT